MHTTSTPSSTPRTPANRAITSRALGLLGTTLCLAGAIALEACEGDEAAPIELSGSDPLFPGFSYDTGLLPDGAPVQASFKVVAEGAANVRASAIPSEGDDDVPTITGVAGSGALGVTGKFGLEGRLVIAVSGLPSYDGPIPGIENVAIQMGAETPFDPFSIGGAVATRADIPPSRLPDIPLPGGIPGSLVLEVAEGSFVNVTMTGVSACASSDEAQYTVKLERSGNLVIKPSVEVEVPLIGTQSFEIPSVEVPLAFDPSTLTMRAEIGELGAEPEGGDAISQSCDGSSGPGGGGPGGSGADGGMGGAMGGGSPEGGAGGGGTTCATRDDCGGLPCVEGHCSNGDGVCEAGISLGEPTLDECVSNNCCVELVACTFDYSDLDGCNDCIAGFGGPRCDGLLACVGGHCDVFTCDPVHFGTNDGCDCGCGIVDPDCPDATAASCSFCDNPGACSEGACPSNIDPNDNAHCL
jgi:hypothetical protein